MFDTERFSNHLKYRLSEDLFCFQDDPLKNLNLAFDIAEKHLDIPKMLDAEGKYFNRYNLKFFEEEIKQIWSIRSDQMKNLS